jgi:hypothetical protein
MWRACASSMAGQAQPAYFRLPAVSVRRRPMHNTVLFRNILLAQKPVRRLVPGLHFISEQDCTGRGRPPAAPFGSAVRWPLAEWELKRKRPPTRQLGRRPDAAIFEFLSFDACSPGRISFDLGQWLSSRALCELGWPDWRAHANRPGEESRYQCAAISATCKTVKDSR